MTVKTLDNQTCYRLIPSHFPPISLFEDVADETEFEALFEIQALTNPRIQDDIGNLALIPKDERCYGISGAGYIMAAFTHINPAGSRFSNGDFGVFYASEFEHTAITETRFHRENFLKASHEPAQELNMRALLATFSGLLVDTAALFPPTHPVHDKTHYQQSQVFGQKIKQEKKDGIIYPSVRDTGINYALFKPNIIHQCLQTKHFGYVWDGNSITSIYEKLIYQ